MAKVIKPDLENIWAAEGSGQPPSLEQILSGWRLNQFPPSEISNWLQRRVEEAVKYIYQVGIVEWDNKTEYRKNSLVMFTNSKVYLSTADNINKAPDTNPTLWKIAFEDFGATAPLTAVINQIIGTDGYLPFYVRKAAPVMTAKATAPSFEADVGAASGFKFKGLATSVTAAGTDLILTAAGVANGRIKSVKPTMEMNDNTLVTTELLKKVVDDLRTEMIKKLEIPVGYSLITKNPKPPSDPAQLGYGTWILDCQGRAIVGVSKDTAASTPEWVKDPDSIYGEYDHLMTLEELVSHEHYMDGRWQDGGAGGIQGGNASDQNIYKTKPAGGSKPFNVVQPSHTKYVWTRTG